MKNQLQRGRMWIMQDSMWCSTCNRIFPRWWFLHLQWIFLPRTRVYIQGMHWDKIQPYPRYIVSYKPRGALPRRHLCTFRILIPYYFVPYFMPLCLSAIPPFRHSTIPPFHQSAILPFRHSAPIRNIAMYVSQEVLRKAVTLPGGLRSNRYVPPPQAK